MKNYSILLAFATALVFVSCQPDPPKNFPTLGMNDTLANGHVLDPNLTSEIYLKKIMEMDSMLLIEMKQPNYHSVSGMSGYYADKKRIDSLLRLNVTLPPMFDSSTPPRSSWGGGSRRRRRRRPSASADRATYSG
ncbi:MAG TPA: hypothetical protein VFJ43_11870, partial [Bacteroidia bacterium]|nr:hypothetical protein [Bacteroidia bacterium]